MTTKRALVPWLLLALVALSPASLRAQCSAPEVCADLSVSLRGEIVDDNVVVEWGTDSETAAVGSYQVYRFNCQDPSCEVYVTAVAPRGSCGVNEPYQVENAPPSPISQWTYQVRVKKVDGSEQCRVNVVPQ